MQWFIRNKILRKGESKTRTSNFMVWHVPDILFGLIFRPYDSNALKSTLAACSFIDVAHSLISMLLPLGTTFPPRILLFVNGVWSYPRFSTVHLCTVRSMAPQVVLASTSVLRLVGFGPGFTGRTKQNLPRVKSLCRPLHSFFTFFDVV